MSRSFALLLALPLIVLLSILQPAEGFSAPTSQISQKQPKQTTAASESMSIEIIATEKSEIDPLNVQESQPQSQEQVTALEHQSPQQHAFLNVGMFLHQQRVVLKTALVVALIAIITKQYPMPFLSPELRKDMLQGTVIFQVGDWAAQFLTHWKNTKQQTQNIRDKHNNNGSKLLGKFQVDNNRFVISTILGAFWAGICNPSVYAVVERMLPGISVKLVLVKMAITCSILSTAGNYTTMMFRRFAKQTWEAKSGTKIRSIFQSCIKSCNEDFMEVLKDDLKIFPAYDILCYSVIPPKVRPLTNALIASAWAMYMSIASAKK